MYRRRRRTRVTICNVKITQAHRWLGRPRLHGQPVNSRTKHSNQRLAQHTGFTQHSIHVLCSKTETHTSSNSSKLAKTLSLLHRAQHSEIAPPPTPTLVLATSQESAATRRAKTQMGPTQAMSTQKHSRSPAPARVPTRAYTKPNLHSL